MVSHGKPGDEDLLDRAAVQTLLTAGTVYALVHEAPGPARRSHCRGTDRPPSAGTATLLSRLAQQAGRGAGAAPVGRDLLPTLSLPAGVARPIVTGVTARGIACHAGEVAVPVTEVQLHGGLPCLSAGHRPPVVVAAGLTPEHANPAGLARRLELARIAALTRHFTVYLVNRKPGLAAESSMADIAGHYAAAAVGYPMTQRRQRAADALAQVGLGRRLDARPTQLSGGSGSGWRSPARLPCPRRSSWPTSPPATSTPRRAPQCWTRHRPDPGRRPQPPHGP
jgi:hypothetical protein